MHQHSSNRLLQPVSTLSTRSSVLRSASNLDLFLLRSRLKLGERAFSIAAPKSVNTLPLTVRQTSNTQTFKRRLKTFLVLTGLVLSVESVSHQGPQLTLPAGMKELLGAPQPHPLTDTAQTGGLADRTDCWKLSDVSHAVNYYYYYMYQ